MKKITTLLLATLILLSLNACSLSNQKESQKIEINSWTSSETITWNLNNENNKVWTWISWNYNDSVKETSDFILSGDSWLYTNNKYGFSLKLPKKYWNKPKIAISCIDNNIDCTDISVDIMVPYVKWEWSDKLFETLQAPTHFILWGFEILTRKEYEKEIVNEHNKREMFNYSGIEILRDLTIWNNNKYFFIWGRVDDIVIENLQNIVPTLNCKLVEKWHYLYSGGDYVPDHWDCTYERDKLFPKWYFTTFDI